MRIGIDIENNSRFELNPTDSFIIDSFTPEEISYCYGKTLPKIHLCGLFCAKEAVKKALTGKNISLQTIEIKHSSAGEPLVVLADEVKKEKAVQNKDLILSISHSEEYSVASVVNLQHGK